MIRSGNQPTSRSDQAIQFNVNGAKLYGVLSSSTDVSDCGVLFLVGGPQYRAGSHRQFTLLARDLANNGYSAMRFDYRGMGDSQGEPQHFLDTADDIKAALNYFFLRQPELRQVVLWGLCDAASAAICYAHTDSRISGLILVNPWVRTDEGIAKTYLKHYYLQRMGSSQFWSKILRGEFRPLDSLKSLLTQLRQAKKRAEHSDHLDQHSAKSLPDLLQHGLQQFSGKTLIILCENDLTSQEFSDLIGSTAEWKKMIASPNFQLHRLAGANHTFSQRNWREQVASWTLTWMKKIAAEDATRPKPR